MDKKTDATGIVYDPQTASRLALELIEQARSEKDNGIRTGISDLDSKLTPLRPGELITVLGYTSNYKSGFMNWLTKRTLETIKEDTNEIVVRVTWEQSVEEDTLSWLANETQISVTAMVRGELGDSEWEILNKASIKRAVTPLWIVGHSQLDRANVRRARPRMTMSDVARALEFISNEATTNQLKIRLIVLDYLQRIRPDPQDGSTKREQMSEAVNRAKDAALAYGCPVLLGVQAGRQVLSREDKTPTLEDGQETSNIEQSSDKVFSLWYPIKTEKPGTTIGGLPVTKNLLIVKVLKQKLGEAPITQALYVDPERNIISNIAKGDIL